MSLENSGKGLFDSWLTRVETALNVGPKNAAEVTAA
jgi:hypothetical protein